MTKKMLLSDRYLSSKIDHIKGIFDGRFPYENWTLVINFRYGNKPKIEAKTFKKEFATEAEAKEAQSRALSIIRQCIKELDKSKV